MKAGIATRTVWALLGAALLPVAFSIAGQPAAADAPRLPAPVVALDESLSVQPAATPAPKNEPFVIKRILDIPGPLKMGDHYWDETGVPAGPMVVTVDLQAQVLSVFRGGYEIGAAAILYGVDEKPTPLGAFPITQKKVHHISNLYGAPMPYMLRLTNDGISIHGSDVKPGRGTHGCIGVPTEFAKKLYSAVKLGDVVLVTRGKMLKMGDSIVG